jgi:hypothetical protein
MWHVPLPLQLSYHVEEGRLARVGGKDAGQWLDNQG